MKSKTKDLTQEEIENAGNSLLGLSIPRAEFDALLIDCDLPNKIAALYRQHLHSGWENAHSGGLTTATWAEVEKRIEPTAQLLKQHIAENLFYVTGILAHQLSISGKGKGASKASIRYLVNLFLIQGAKSAHLMQDGRGRPPVWTHAKIEQKIRSAVSGFRKKRYRNPTLAEAANELKMSIGTLKKLLQRHGLRYSTYKKET